MKIGKFQQQILNWFDQHGRKDLPWQLQRSSYHVWVSEIMLQQTQVNTVIPFYLRFIKRFPNIKSLAKAETDEVLALWSGLGYYARARNLHRTAQIISQQFRGKFPNDTATLESLPGIGRSTAGAILALSMQQRAAILDGNVKRVLCRYHVIDEWPGKPESTKKLWLLAEQYTPQDRVTDYTQAMMDLGALICTRSKPKCAQCPLRASCAAFKQNNPTAYPVVKPRKNLPVRSIFMLMLNNEQGEILLEKRPPVGIWGGLWSFPECPIDKNIQDWCQQQHHCQINIRETWPVVRHTFSHFHLDITPVWAQFIRWNNSMMESSASVWYKVTHAKTKGLATPVKKLLLKLSEQNI